MNHHPDAGFHPGELDVQRRAGVRDEAARLSGMLEPVELTGGIATFLAARTFAVLTARDHDGRLWATPLIGPPGFLAVAAPTVLAVAVTLSPGDPLYGLEPGQQVGLIVVEFTARRRVRVNGTLAQVSQYGLAVQVEQAYGNCPRYIQQRALGLRYPDQNQAAQSRRGTTLAQEDVALIRAADTFFLGTTHPERGTDASHRGGPPGFVRVEGDRLWWPDYPGNNLFNSFGNLAVDPEAALLFVDFTTGATLQLSGAAQVDWGEPGRSGDDGHTGRRVWFTLEQFCAGQLLDSRQAQHQASPYNFKISR
jgi:uncharacterized protein